MSDTENNNEDTTPLEEPVVTKKDPKKVEQGKRLAMISKEAKERKMRARIEREQKENESWWRHTPLVVAVGSSLGFIVTLYLLSRKTPEERVVVEKKKEVVSNKNFEEL